MHYWSRRVLDSGEGSKHRLGSCAVRGRNEERRVYKYGTELELIYT